MLVDVLCIACISNSTRGSRDVPKKCQVLMAKGFRDTSDHHTSSSPCLLLQHQYVWFFNQKSHQCS